MRPRRHVQRAGTRPSYTRRPVPPPRRPRPRLQLPVIRAAWIRYALAGVVVLLVFVIISKMTALKQVKIEGAHTMPETAITTLVKAGLKKQWFGRNTVLTNKSALAHYIEKADPAIKKAHVRKRGLHTIAVQIEERTPTLNWKTGGTTYLLDADATVIGPTGPAYAALPTVNDSSSLPVKTGDRVAPTSFVTFCSQLAKLLPAAGYTVNEMTVPESTSEVYVSTANITLKFDTTRPAGEEVADLQAVQKELSRARKTAKEYIDLRIAHKAYYK